MIFKAERFEEKRSDETHPKSCKHLLERFFVCSIFKAERFEEKRPDETHPKSCKSLLERFFVCSIFKAELFRIQSNLFKLRFV